MIPEFVLDHPIRLKIFPQLRQSVIMSFRDLEHRDMKTGYHWYKLPRALINDATVIVSLCFFNQKLDSVNLSLWNPESYGCSWADFSEEKERLCAKHTEEWLRKLGYPTGKYDWGEIWAGYDPKGGSGGAGVRYFANHRKPFAN